MAQPTQPTKPTSSKKPTRHLLDEADIGSGEKTPAEHDTEKLIEQVGEQKNKSKKTPTPQQPGK